MRSQRSQLPFAGAALAVFLSSAIGFAAQSTPGRTLLALSKPNHTLAIVDPNTLQDEKQIYTTNVSSATVSILEKVILPPVGPPPGMRPPQGSQPPQSPPGGTQPRTDWNETVIPVGKGDEGFDVSPDGRELWTANAQDGTLSVVDLTTRTVTAASDSMAVKPEALP